MLIPPQLVAVDTNVFVSALLHGRIPHRVYDTFLDGRVTPVFSSDTLRELIDVLTRPALRLLTSSADVQELLTLVQRDGLLIRPTHRITACRDPKDNMWLECAVAGGAAYLVTGDLDLLVLDPFRGIRILRPRDFLSLLP